MRINHLHVAENYLERVLGVEPDEAEEEQYDMAIESVKRAVEDPETVYHGEKESCPVHIRDGAAVPVKRDSGEIVVSTVYDAENFLRKLKKYEPAAA